MEERRALVALNTEPRLAGRRLGKAIRESGSVRALLESRIDRDALCKKGEREIAEAADEGISIVTELDPSYPGALRRIPTRPPVLYARGEIPPDSLIHLGVVGSRKATKGGLDEAWRISHELALSGAVVVSGLALGIDGAAHEGALAAGGKTVAVLGSGILRIHPRRHIGLAERIVSSGGTLVSEFPLHTEPRGVNFPRRNRIIAGLSSGVVVVEAAARSGALITARLAAEFGRDVFALKGPAEGPNREGAAALIADGVAEVSTAGEILSSISRSGLLSSVEGDPVIAALGKGSTPGEAAGTLGREVAEVEAAISALLDEGRIVDVGEGRFAPV